MAALVFTAAASSLSGALGLGTFGSALLQAGTGIAGGLVDQALLAPDSDDVEGPRLASLDVTSSTEGAPVPRVYGRVRVGGQIIWATELVEEAVTTTQRSGGKFGIGGRTVSSTDYRYYGNLAVAIAEGYVSQVTRIWADNRELDLTAIAWRFYPGSETGGADPLIAAKEGSAPAYRGTAYVVFERLPLEEFGNRLPQLSFEVIRVVDTLESKITSVALIPGATEFGYEPAEMSRVSLSSQGDIVWSETENRHHLAGVSDWDTSLDHLARVLPNCTTIHLVVTWFGTDLRAGACQIKPMVERKDKTTHPFTWAVSGLTRETADAVSTHNGRPAYGGSPSDASVIHAIGDLKARGYKVMLHPFIMMDVPHGNGLPDPHGGARQAPYPWRGRITCHPAPGRSGSPDKTGTAGAQLAPLIGTAAPGHFAAVGETVSYSGPAEWSYRRFVLHMAHLSVLAGGVDAFLIGSEMVGLTTVRDGPTSYPFVAALKALAGDARSIVGSSVKIGYGADWSEYHSHRPDDGSGDVLFNMDPLWSDPAIDFIGIDNYLPSTDWRSGSGHADHEATGPLLPHDPAYLAGNVEGGEYHDWYYASDADRRDQVRTPISDGAHGEHFVFRQKDIRNWWSSAHHDRPGGVRSGSPTAWSPRSKPVWFTELGAPALENAGNQPNVFYDPKSSESALPHFSTGVRDDAMQRRAVEAVIDYWWPSAGNNPVSPAYGGYMIDVGRTAIWAWDARPFPAFPRDIALWADGLNWRFGHWISGRMGTAPVDALIRQMAIDHGVTDLVVPALHPAVDGYVLDRPTSLRDAVDPVLSAFGLMAVDDVERVRIAPRRGQLGRRTFAIDDLVDTGADEALTRRRKDESGLPLVIRVSHRDTDQDARPGLAAASRTASLATDRIREIRTAAFVDAARARSQADVLLQRIWGERESAEFALPPSGIDLQPGDVVTLPGDTTGGWLIQDIRDGEYRQVSATRHANDVHTPAPPPLPAPRPVSRPTVRATSLTLIECRVPVSDAHPVILAAGVAVPWGPGLAIYRARDVDDLDHALTLSQPATTGRLIADLHGGPVWRWDRGNSIFVELRRGALASVSEASVLGGANRAAIDTGDGWEIVQFRDAELIDERTYRLDVLLRGQAGSEALVSGVKPAGARFVVLDDAVRPLPLTAGTNLVGVTTEWRFGPSDKAPSIHFGALDHDVTGTSLRPLSPVHLTARRESATGDVLIDWIRRTRTGGDSWAPGDVPLGEDNEAYAVDILDPGDAVLRTVTADTPSYRYIHADQIADFGAAGPFDVVVSQLSAVLGRGDPARRTIDV